MSTSGSANVTDAEPSNGDAHDSAEREASTLTTTVGPPEVTDDKLAPATSDAASAAAPPQATEPALSAPLAEVVVVSANANDANQESTAAIDNDKDNDDDAAAGKLVSSKEAARSPADVIAERLARLGLQTAARPARMPAKWLFWQHPGVHLPEECTFDALYLAITTSAASATAADWLAFGTVVDDVCTKREGPLVFLAIAHWAARTKKGTFSAILLSDVSQDAAVLELEGSPFGGAPSNPRPPSSRLRPVLEAGTGAIRMYSDLQSAHSLLVSYVESRTLPLGTTVLSSSTTAKRTTRPAAQNTSITLNSESSDASSDDESERRSARLRAGANKAATRAVIVAAPPAPQRKKPAARVRNVVLKRSSPVGNSLQSASDEDPLPAPPAAPQTPTVFPSAPQQPQSQPLPPQYHYHRHQQQQQQQQQQQYGQLQHVHVQRGSEYASFNGGHVVFGSPPPPPLQVSPSWPPVPSSPSLHQLPTTPYWPSHTAMAQPPQPPAASNTMLLFSAHQRAQDQRDQAALVLAAAHDRASLALNASHQRAQDQREFFQQLMGGGGGGGGSGAPSFALPPQQ